MPDGPITCADLASGGSSGIRDRDLPIPSSLFQAGANLIAVEIHQSSQTSGDIRFDLDLQGDFLPAGESPRTPAAADQLLATESVDTPHCTSRPSHS